MSIFLNLYLNFGIITKFLTYMVLFIVYYLY